MPLKQEKASNFTGQDELSAKVDMLSKPIFFAQPKLVPQSNLL